MNNNGGFKLSGRRSINPHSANCPAIRMPPFPKTIGSANYPLQNYNRTACKALLLNPRSSEVKVEAPRAIDKHALIQLYRHEYDCFPSIPINEDALLELLLRYQICCDSPFPFFEQVTFRFWRWLAEDEFGRSRAAAGEDLRKLRLKFIKLKTALTSLTPDQQPHFFVSNASASLALPDSLSWLLQEIMEATQGLQHSIQRQTSRNSKILQRLLNKAEVAFIAMASLDHAALSRFQTAELTLGSIYNFQQSAAGSYESVVKQVAFVIKILESAIAGSGEVPKRGREISDSLCFLVWNLLGFYEKYSKQPVTHSGTVRNEYRGVPTSRAGKFLVDASRLIIEFPPPPARPGGLSKSQAIFVNGDSFDGRLLTELRRYTTLQKRQKALDIL